MRQNNHTHSEARVLKGKSIRPITKYVEGLEMDTRLRVSFGDDFEMLVEEMLGVYKHFLSRRNLASVLYLAIVEFEMDEGYDGVAANEDLRDRLSSKLKTSLDSFPHPFEVWIAMPSFRKPNESFRLDITPGMRLEFQSNSLVGKSCSLVISDNGYLDAHMDSAVGVRVLSKAKILVFLMRSLNLIDFNSFGTRAEGEFIDLSSPDISRTKMHMPDGLARCFGGMTQNLGTLLRPVGNESEIRLSSIFENLVVAMEKIKKILLVSEKEEFISISTAIEWYEESHFVDNQTVAYLEICIGFEALLQDENGHMEEMTNRLCDRFAFALARSRQERKELAETYRRVLNLRGKLVHSKQARLDDAGRDMLDKARHMLKCLIESELALAIAAFEPSTATK